MGAKRRDYAALGIPEYWRFDEAETVRHHGERLAGDWLADGEYVAIEIEELAEGSLRGYSAALNLHLRWEQGELAFCDPAIGRRIATFEDERVRADTAEAELGLEREARVSEQARADSAGAELAAEQARVRKLEEQIRR